MFMPEVTPERHICLWNPNALAMRCWDSWKSQRHSRADSMWDRCRWVTSCFIGPLDMFQWFSQWPWLWYFEAVLCSCFRYFAGTSMLPTQIFSYRVTDVTVNISSVHQSSFSFCPGAQPVAQRAQPVAQPVAQVMPRHAPHVQPAMPALPTSMSRAQTRPAPSCTILLRDLRDLISFDASSRSLPGQASGGKLKLDSKLRWPRCLELPWIACLILLGYAFQSVSGL